MTAGVLIRILLISFCLIISPYVVNGFCPCVCTGRRIFCAQDPVTRRHKTFRNSCDMACFNCLAQTNYTYMRPKRCKFWSRNALIKEEG